MEIHQESAAEAEKIAHGAVAALSLLLIKLRARLTVQSISSFSI
jgi:hypothetical protein